MVVHGNREELLGLVLSDDVLVEILLSNHYLVNHSVLLSLFGVHPVVAVRVGPYLVEWSVRVVGDDGV